MTLGATEGRSAIQESSVCQRLDVGENAHSFRKLCSTCPAQYRVSPNAIHCGGQGPIDRGLREPLPGHAGHSRELASSPHKLREINCPADRSGAHMDASIVAVQPVKPNYANDLIYVGARHDRRQFAGLFRLHVLAMEANALKRGIYIGKPSAERGGGCLARANEEGPSGRKRNVTDEATDGPPIFAAFQVPPDQVPDVVPVG